MESPTAMKSSILDLIDFTTPNADWKNFDGFLNEINHEAITNRIKIRQRIISVGGGNKIVTAGYAAGCCGGENKENAKKWRRMALYITDICNVSTHTDVCYVCRRKKNVSARICCGDCLEITNSSKIYYVGIVSYNRNLTIVTTANHIMFCYGITHGHRIDILCKSVTASKWNDINIFNWNIHLDMVGVHNEHCFNKHSPCKCVKLSKQIFYMNLYKFTIFIHINLEIKDIIYTIMRWFININ
jgi:hypothetical protein